MPAGNGKRNFHKFVIKDSGVGISSEFISKIYEPFTQERSEETAGISGSGLGLSIVKRLVDLMNGSIRAESRLGEGTEFTVYLTFRKAAESAGQHQAEEESNFVLEGGKILLCEDNEMNREIATAILEKSRHVGDPGGERQRRR